MREIIVAVVVTLIYASLNLLVPELIRQFMHFMREKHLDRISKGTYLPVTALTYSDMVVALRKIRAHSFLMAMAIENLNAKHD